MSNVFYSKFSEVSGERLDPLFYSGEIKGFFLKFKYPIVSLSQLVKSIESGIGAGKNDQSHKINGILHIRPTNISSDGYLILKKNIYIPPNNRLSKVKIDDVLFNNTNSQEWVGKTIYIDEKIKAYFSNHITRIRVKDNIYGKYLWIILNFYQRKRIFYNLCTNWNNQSGIGLDVLKKLKIPVPNKSIQLTIVKKIDNALKQKQQKEQEAQRKLESIDSYLLKELGVALPKDGDDSLEDRVFFRKFSELKGRFDGVYYSEKFVALEKALSNSNYPLMRLGDICKINRGGSPRPIHDFITDDEDGINWIKIGDTKGIDKYIYKTKQKIIPKGVKHSRMVYEGDFILSNSMSFGRPYIMKTTGCIHDGWLLLRKKENIVSEDFLYSILNSALIYKFFKKETIGGVVENLSIDLVKKIKIPIPPLEIQNKIANNNQKLLNEVESLKKEAKEIYNNAKEEVEKMILGEN
jgi:restriction endonuclease S subunit